MKLRFIIWLCIFLFAFMSEALANQLKVVTSFPDLADMAKKIGKNHVDVVSLATGMENLHFVPQKPGFLITLRKADVLIVLGLDAEHSWIPPLVQASLNLKITVGKPGYIDASKYIIPIQVPVFIDPALGDLHPRGNPHYNLDPKSGPKMAKAIAEGLIKNDPAHKGDYEANLAVYLEELNAKWQEWKIKGQALQGIRFISYHQTFGYLAERFKMTELGTIQLAPGIEPTPGHLNKLLKLAQQNSCDLVFSELGYSESTPKRIANQLNIPMVRLPVMTGAISEIKTWTDLIDYLISSILEKKQGNDRKS